jgi:tagatose-1,6-bisphosphate aldolase non-catalytic subunit AgaZ/GatZ
MPIAGFQEKNLVRQQLTAVIATLYTVPGGMQTIVRNVHFTNTTNANRRVTLHLVAFGDSAVDGNKLFHEILVPANGVFEYCSWRVLNSAGDTIRGFADAANSVTVHIDGAEIS